MPADLDVEEALRAAHRGRVSLGSYTAEQLWQYGVPLPGAGVSPAAPMTDEVPEGPRIWRLAMRPPRAVFSTATAEPGVEWEHVNRFGELVGPDLVRVRETTDRNRTFDLSLQPLRALVETALTDSGVFGPAPDLVLHSRLFSAFPYRMTVAAVRGVRRITQQPFPLAERLWMDVTVDRSPTSLRVSEVRSARAAGFRTLPADADPAAVLAHVLAFYRHYWPEVPT
jgi:hypothetical protein